MKTPHAIPGPDVQLHIENLVLHGFDSLDHSGIVSTVERELARLMAADGVSAMSADISHLDGGEFRIGTGAQAETIAIEVAESVYRCVNRDLNVTSKPKTFPCLNRPL